MTLPAGEPDAGDLRRWVNPATGHAIAYRSVTPASVRFIAVVIHGFNEHGGRHRAMIDVLASAGGAVIVPDLWGHGRSGGPRGDVRAYQDHMSDLAGVAAYAAGDRASAMPWHVVGHSVGGLLALLWLEAEPDRFARAVVQSPLLSLGFEVPGWLRAVAGAATGIAPGLSVRVPLDGAALTHDPAVARAYEHDPDVHGRITLRCWRELQAAMRDARAGAPRIRTPVLMLCGEADRIVSVEAGRALFDSLTCRKRWQAYPGMYHELHHEPVRDAVFGEIRTWLAPA